MKKLRRTFLVWLYRKPVFAGVKRRMTERHLTILLYHFITPDLFANNLEFLTQNYNIISLRDVRNALRSEIPKPLPPCSLVITFDDGWRSNYDLLPVLKRYECPITIFLTAGLVNTNRKIWNSISRPGNQAENQWLKTLPNTEKDRYLKKKFNHYPEKEYEDRIMLNLAEIEEMKPYVDFQSHGMFHPLFPLCSNKELAYELSESKRLLSSLLETEIYAVSYPYGRASQREMMVAQTAGYQIGRIAADFGVNRIDENPMALKSIGVDGVVSSIEELEKRMAWGQLRTLLHWN